MSIDLTSIILPAFYDFHNDVRDPDILHYVLKGGRGSAKSTHIGIELVLRRMNTKSHALVVRKYGVYIRKSVFEQCKWAVAELGVGKYWKETKSPLGLVYLPTGASIIFSGANDPTLLKSLMMSSMPITDLWIEEETDFRTEEEIRTITNTIVRKILPKGLNYKVFHSYNPPKRKGNWLNKKYETVFIPDNVRVHHSDYRDNPYLSNELLTEIEITRENNFKIYQWEYLGLPVGSGVVPFDNLEFRTITDDEIAQFDNIKQGIDWGYGVDPLCFGRMHYDRTRKILYIFDEIYGVKISNEKLAKQIIEKGYDDFKIVVDSAEPKSKDQMIELGVSCEGAKKGAGSVEFGEKWLDELQAIIIDPNRCANISREFESIDYDVDKDGNTLARLSGVDNHSIDMVRYACEDEMVVKKLGSLSKRGLGI